jgi:hypothetical protein
LRELPGYKVGKEHKQRPMISLVKEMDLRLAEWLKWERVCLASVRP